MKKSKTLIACKIFADEFPMSVASDEDLEIIWIDEALHVNLSRLEESIRQALSEVGKEKSNIYLLFGSGCHPDINLIAEQYGVCVSPVQDCIEAYCGKKKMEIEESGSMIMTPAWVRAWPAMMEAQGWDEVDARINLGRYERILVLDSGINPLKDEEVLEFFDLVQVPVEIEPLSLQHFKGVVGKFLKQSPVNKGLEQDENQSQCNCRLISYEIKGVS